jgi:hypothetical protein
MRIRATSHTLCVNELNYKPHTLPLRPLLYALRQNLSAASILRHWLWWTDRVILEQDDTVIGTEVQGIWHDGSLSRRHTGGDSVSGKMLHWPKCTAHLSPGLFVQRSVAGTRDLRLPWFRVENEWRLTPKVFVTHFFSNHDTMHNERIR